MKTFEAKNENIDRKWWIVDAKGQILGRVASKIATILRGKNKATFTKNIDSGDFVVVINAEQVKLTGKKETQKNYYKHSGTPGGFKTTSVQKMRLSHPERIIEFAVKGMLPKNKLSSRQITKLKVYRGEAHPHKAQNPISVAL